MNLREGKIGRQEGASLCGVAALMLLLFVANSSAQYGAGNVSYGAYLFAALFTLLLFLFVAQTMERWKQPELASFLRAGLGSLLSIPAALLLILCMLALAALLLGRFTAIMQENVFLRAGRELLGLYGLLPAAILAFCGFETLGRSARLLLWLLPVSLFMALALAAADYDPARLAPYAVLDWPRTLFSASAAVPLLLLPAVACLATASGQHSVGFARKNGRLGLLAAGVLGIATQLMLGMRFPYGTLAQTDMPLYALTMQLETGGSFGRPDLLLLFVWLMFAILGAGYLIYGAALLFARTFSMEDVRPAAAGASAIALALLCRQGWWGSPARVMQYAGLCSAAVLLLAAVLLRFREMRGKEHK